MMLVASVAAQIPANYYSGVEGKQGESLREALHACIKSHTTLNYDALEDYYGPTDFRPDGTLWDIYSNCEFTKAEANKPQSDFCQGWNKEHTVCQSWFGGASPMYSDIFHVLPTDARVNNLRSNWPYGETNSRNDKISQGNPVSYGHLGSSSFSGYTNVGTVYEPDDRYKGDIARIYFYMVTCYRNKALNSSNGAKMFTYSGGVAGLTDYSVALLMKWHRADPVSQKEINRNDSVYKVQKNRNPFVDFPDLAEYIWGNKKTTTVSLSTLLSAYDSDYVPLDTEGGSNQQDYAKFGVTWYVNGEKIRTDSVYKNHKLSELPQTPVSCSATSTTFMGWSNAVIAGTMQTKPEFLFASVTDAPAINANTSFYAVFAHEEQGQGQGEVTATASFTTADGYKRGDKPTSAQAGKVTIKFDKGTNKNETAFFTEIRSYGGSTITLSGATMSRVEFVLGPNDKGNALKPNVGKMDATGLVWTGSASSIVFTVDGDSGYRGLSAIRVTYDDNTTVFAYSDYLTNCGYTGENLEEITNTAETIPAAKKILKGGKLYIQIGTALYTVTGQKVSER